MMVCKHHNRFRLYLPNIVSVEDPIEKVAIGIWKAMVFRMQVPWFPRPNGPNAEVPIDETVE